MSNTISKIRTRSFSIKCACLAFVLAGSMVAVQADYEWRFDQGTNSVTGVPNEDSIAWSLDTGGLSVTTSSSSDDAGFNSHNTLSGSGTLNDSFGISMEAGFGFDPSSPTYDTTDYSGTKNGPTNNVLRFRVNSGTPEGVSPLGQGVGFSGAQSGVVDSEILHFTISGLDPGQLFQIKGYELKDAAADRVDLYYGAGVTKYDTLVAIEDVSGLNIVLGNGDQFGFGYDRDTGNRSGLKAISFDIVLIPEPTTAALMGLGLLGLFLARRR